LAGVTRKRYSRSFVSFDLKQSDRVLSPDLFFMHDPLVPPRPTWGLSDASEAGAQSPYDSRACCGLSSTTPRSFCKHVEWPVQTSALSLTKPAPMMSINTILTTTRNLSSGSQAGEQNKAPNRNARMLSLLNHIPRAALKWVA
jgi:hypothetical protein